MEIDLKWIKKQIVNEYLKALKTNEGFKKNMERKLVTQNRTDEQGKLKHVFFILDGSPPKGYALYAVKPRCLDIISMSGEKTKRFEDISIKGIDATR